MKQRLTARDIQSYVKLAIWIVVIGILCFSPGNHMNGMRLSSLIPAFINPYADKIIHFTMFFILAFLIKSLHWQKTIDTKTYHIYILAGVAYAVATELIQHFFIFMRSGDILDFASDSIGMALSILIFPFYPKFIRWIFG